MVCIVGILVGISRYNVVCCNSILITSRNAQVKEDGGSCYEILPVKSYIIVLS
jgi:hypothetical protein